MYEPPAKKQDFMSKHLKDTQDLLPPTHYTVKDPEAIQFEVKSIRFPIARAPQKDHNRRDHRNEIMGA